MTRLMRPAALVLMVVVIALPGIADQAKSLYEKGQDAEARQNYEKAYDDFKQAYDLKPKELRYRSAFERLRFLAAAAKVHRGQLLRGAGKLEEALAEFQKAAEIDSSSFIALQEIKETQRLIEATKNAPRSAAPPPGALQKRLEQAQGAVELAAIPNVPITLMVSGEDTKTIYETIGKLAGINVLFDPEYVSRRIRVELNGVTLEDALAVVEMESKTFWRAVTPNTIFVAQDNPAKRKEIEQNLIKTFYLTNLSQPTEIQELVNGMRQILDITKVLALPSEGAVVVRGTPDQIALAKKLIDDLDKAKSEVVVDVAILQVSRDKAHTLGINPPTSASVALQNNINTNTTTTPGTTNTGATSSTSGTPNQVNFNRLGNLNATDFTVTIPQATATALFSDSNTKVLQNPQIRSVDGQKATLKIGSKIPYASGSFQPGIGGVGINPLVNTQFQYQDVGVTVELTPRIHAGGDVSMHVNIVVSSVLSQANIGGITQPVIGNNSMEHDISLRDGEVSLLGGIFTDQETRSLTGIPGLAQIPILKYFFAQSQTDHMQSETVFVLIPHIVRKREIDDLNEKAISVGTFNSLQLSRENPQAASQPPAAAPGVQSPASAPAMQPQAGAPAAPAAGQPIPSAGSPATPAAPTGAASFSFDPGSITQKAGSNFAVNVLLNGAQNVYAVPLEVSYDPKLLQVTNVSNGGFLSQDGQAVVMTHRGDDDNSGTVHIAASRPMGAAGVSGQGAVVTLTFLAKSSGQGTLTISQGGARTPAMQNIPVAGAVASVTVQ